MQPPIREQEKANWDQQKGMMAGLLKDIDQKEKEALSERGKWINKRKSYRSEAEKWGKANQLADQTYIRFKQLKD